MNNDYFISKQVVIDRWNKYQSYLSIRAMEDNKALRMLPPVQSSSVLHDFVRCKDCTYWEKQNSFATIGFCKLPGEVERERSWHDYCSRAERREE